MENFFYQKLCVRPWDYIEITADGNVWPCCSSWLPNPLGNILSDDLDNIYNSDSAKKIRKSIMDGSFEYCDKSKCQLIASNNLLNRKNEDQVRYLHVDYGSDTVSGSPFFYNLCYDDSCNLACPKCRKDFLSLSEGGLFEKRSTIHTRILSQLFKRPTKRYRRINISGSGDPFVSVLYMDMLKTIPWDLFPNTIIDFQTNGLLLTKSMWQMLIELNVRVGVVAISIDAASSEIYSLVRRGGNFEILMNNLRLVNSLREKNEISYFRLDFVVQRSNYLEIPKFVSLMQLFPSVDRISFSLIADWGSYALEDFYKEAIWNKNHPEHESFLKVLESACFDDERVFLGNLSTYRLKNRR
ncbi:MAG: SPASM domain-containing protein [Candidatus Omnitrophota bacterium]|jgi:MoaA/NifB/PqqE/SkfB family radical SAM enzyme